MQLKFVEDLPAKNEEENQPLPLAYWTVQERIFPSSGQLPLQTQESNDVFLSPGTAQDAGTRLEFFAVRLHSAEGLGTRGAGIVDLAEPATRTAVTQDPPADLTGIMITPSAVAINLGDKVPVTVLEEAQTLLTRAPWPALRALLNILREWSSQGQVKAARVRILREPEDPTWTELAIELRLSVDTNEAALELWEEIGALMDQTKSAFAPEDKAWFERYFAVHLHWGADPWDDKSESI